MKYIKDGIQIEIDYDIDPQNPRDWDNLGVMVCWHKRYTLGDKHDIKSEDYKDWDEIEDYILFKLEAIAVIPLYMMDHSGLTIRAERFGGIYGHWDSGQIGYIYALKNDETDKMTPEHIDKVLRSEIEVYNQYVQGDVWGFTKSRLEKCSLGETHEILIDSCWGFYDMSSLYESAGIEDIDEWSEVK